MFTSALRAAAVAALTATLGVGLASGAWADPTAANTAPTTAAAPAPAAHHSREHDPGHATSTPVLPKPRSGAIINRGPLDPLEIAGAKSALDRLAFATKFLSTKTTGEVLIPPYLPGAVGERITVGQPLGNAPAKGTSLPITHSCEPSSDDRQHLLDAAFPRHGQIHRHQLMHAASPGAARAADESRVGRLCTAGCLRAVPPADAPSPSGSPRPRVDGPRARRAPRRGAAAGRRGRAPARLHRGDRPDPARGKRHLQHLYRKFGVDGARHGSTGPAASAAALQRGAVTVADAQRAGQPDHAASTAVARVRNSSSVALPVSTSRTPLTSAIHTGSPGRVP